MLQPKLSYEILWKDLNSPVPNSGFTFTKSCNEYDAIRIMHDEYYSNSGGYKCSDFPITNNGTVSINLPFYEGNWFDRSFAFKFNSDSTVLEAKARQQCRINETTANSTNQTWSSFNSCQNSNIHAIYGVKYFDTEPSAENKIYGDRTLLFKNDSYWGSNNTSGVTAYNLSEPMSSFEFVEFYSSQQFPCYIAPGWAKSFAPSFILQSDTSWYYRTTNWSAVNGSTRLQGYRYCQWGINPSARVQDMGNIPAKWNRNVNFSRIYGVGRK